MFDDIFYSRRKRKIFTLDELEKLFVRETNLWKIDFKLQSKHIKIVNVDAYILNQEIDALFTFADLREQLAGIEKLELKHKISADLIFPELTGVTQVEGSASR